MKRLLLILAIFHSCAMTKEGRDQIPLRNFFRNSQMTHFGISPNGQHISYLKNYKKRLNLYIRDSKDFNNERRITSISERNISHYFWKNDQTLIFIRDFGGDENYHVYKVNIKDLKVSDLTPYPNTKATMIDSLSHLDSDEILLGLNDRDKKYFDVYRINILTGERKLVYLNTQKFTHFKTGWEGELKFGIVSDGVNKTTFVRKNKRWQKIIKTNFKNNFVPLKPHKDERYFYAVSDLGRDKESLILYDSIAKREVKVIHQNEKYDISGINYSKRMKKIYSVKVKTWKDEEFLVDQDYKKLYKKIKSNFPHDEIKISRWNSKEDKLIVISYSDVNPAQYFLYDKNTQKLKFLAKRSPWLNSKKLASMKPITYQARDGLSIDGYLTLPLKKVEKYPLVVIPHGGPWTRDTWGYRPLVQFLANRGYAVFQMNFRGSTGYGRKFWMSSFKKWGKEMQDDITDGVHSLVSKNIVDQKKICIYGGSYGGYAVLAGLAFTPDLYACGVDYVGVSNLFTLLKTIPPYWEPYREMLYEKIGHPQKEKELLRAASPLFHVDKITKPLLIAQGANDPRVKQSESDQIVKALRDKGMDVPYILKKDEGHGFRNEENRIEFYTRVEQFLERYLK